MQVCGYNFLTRDTWEKKSPYGQFWLVFFSLDLSHDTISTLVCEKNYQELCPEIQRWFGFGWSISKLYILCSGRCKIILYRIECIYKKKLKKYRLLYSMHPENSLFENSNFGPARTEICTRATCVIFIHSICARTPSLFYSTVFSIIIYSS